MQVSKWCAYKADQEKLSVEDIWIKLYGVEVKQELTDYGSPGANAVIKALRQKLYGGLKFFGDYLGIGFAVSAKGQSRDEWPERGHDLNRVYTFYTTSTSNNPTEIGSRRDWTRRPQRLLNPAGDRPMVCRDVRHREVV